MSEAGSTLSHAAAKVGRDGVASVAQLHEQYIPAGDADQQMQASVAMRPDRLGCAAHIAHHALNALRSTDTPKFAPHVYTPESIVDRTFLSLVTLSLTGTNKSFEDTIEQAVSSEEASIQSIREAYSWMVAFEGERIGSGTDITAPHNAGIEAPFFTIANSLLTHVIPAKWAEQNPSSPLSVQKFFEIAFARQTGNILSVIASFDPKRLMRVSYGISSPDRNKVEQLDTQVFLLDTNAIRLNEELLPAIESRGLQRILSDENARRAYQRTPDVAPMGCVMNVSQRAFHTNMPAETLMMAYYHYMLAMCQKGLYKKEYQS